MVGPLEGPREESQHIDHLSHRQAEASPKKGRPKEASGLDSSEQ